LQLSKPAARLRAALDSFVKLPLVVHEGPARLPIAFNHNSQLYWDKAQLQRVAAWKDSWDGFWKANLESGTDAVLENMQNAFAMLRKPISWTGWRERSILSMPAPPPTRWKA